MKTARNVCGWIMMGISSIYSIFVFIGFFIAIVGGEIYGLPPLLALLAIIPLMIMSLPIVFWFTIFFTKNTNIQLGMSIALLVICILILPIGTTLYMIIPTGILGILVANKKKAEIKFYMINGEFSWRLGRVAPEWIIKELDPQFLMQRAVVQNQNVGL